ncbi:MAG: hypothetical protein QXW41_09470 [Fervidicoccaceae archaeon]
MEQEPRKAFERNVAVLHPTLLLLSRLFTGLGLRVFIIDARSIVIHGVDLGRETRDWDVAIDKPFTPELRNAITRELRSRGFKVQWRKWGFLVEDDVNVDINYARLRWTKSSLIGAGGLQRTSSYPAWRTSLS